MESAHSVLAVPPLHFDLLYLRIIYLSSSPSTPFSPNSVLTSDWNMSIYAELEASYTLEAEYTTPAGMQRSKKAHVKNKQCVNTIKQGHLCKLRPQHVRGLAQVHGKGT